MAMSVGIARASANAAERCGDMAASWTTETGVLLAIADGLGHGTDAAQAAEAAIAYVGTHRSQPLPDLFQGLHRALASTRGAAVAIAVIAPSLGRLTYAAIGNTRAALIGWQVQRLDAMPGIVGAGSRRVTPLTLPCRPGDTLALWTDGLADRLSFDGLDPGASDTEALALDLLHRNSKGTDDSCVVIAQLRPH